MTQPTFHYTLRESLRDLVEDGIKVVSKDSPIQDYDWGICHSCWRDALGQVFGFEGDLLSTLGHLLQERGQTTFAPILLVCCSCIQSSSVYHITFGSDQIAYELLELCKSTSNREELFVYLALRHYNSMVVVGRSSAGRAAAYYNYNTLVNLCIENGKLPAEITMPSPSEIIKVSKAFEETSRPKGCLIPFAILASGLLAVVVVIVRLV